MQNSSNLENFLMLMWNDYCEMNPQAQEIYNLFSQNGEKIVNDHIALRTFNHPKLGITSLATHFTKYGYIECGEYTFTEKKLYAKHYQHKENPHYPKIFISELELEKCSPFIQKTLSAAAEQVDPQSIRLENFVYNGKSWNTEYSTYQKLAQESEYASWVYAFGFRPNHFTVSINHLSKLKTIEQVNELLLTNGFKLNTSGGIVKGTPQELLEQSSTMANTIEVKFSDGVFSIPACYYEFAKRYSQTDGKLYQGFIAKSADKIFESTNQKN